MEKLVRHSRRKRGANGYASPTAAAPVPDPTSGSLFRRSTQAYSSIRRAARRVNSLARSMQGLAGSPQCTSVDTTTWEDSRKRQRPGERETTTRKPA